MFKVNAIERYFLFSAGLLSKERICSPMGSIFFPLIVAFLRLDFLYAETYSPVQKLIFDDMDTNMLRQCVNLLLILQLNLKLYFAVSYFDRFCFYSKWLK